MTAERLSAAALRRIDNMRRDVFERIEKVLARLPKSGGKIALRDELKSLAAIRTEILAIMRENGRADVLSVAGRAVVDALEEAVDKADATDEEGDAISMKASARRRILASATGALDAVADAFDEAAREVRAVLDVSEVAGEVPRRLITGVQDAIGTSFSRAQNAVETAIFGAYRAALFEQAQRGAEADGEPMGFLYDGPEDEKMRPFCRARWGIVYTARAIARLTNGQIEPVSQFCGGFRCRHRWSPITLEDARAEGYRVVLR